MEKTERSSGSVVNVLQIHEVSRNDISADQSVVCSEKSLLHDTKDQ